MKNIIILLFLFLSIVAQAQVEKENNQEIGSFYSQGEPGLWDGHNPALVPSIPNPPDYVEKMDRQALAQPWEAKDRNESVPISRKGALSGKFIYVNAGHGFINKNGSWNTQRGNLYEMVEDHANADQVAYFMIEYLRNAGATVIPIRDVGAKTDMYIIDNDDGGFSVSGTWYESVGTVFWGNASDAVHYAYTNTKDTETAVARWTPNIARAGRYPVFVWYSDGTNRCTAATYRIVHAGGTDVVVLDQYRTGKGWIWLGTYYFAKGTGGYVELSNQSTDKDKVVIADAVRFGSGVHPESGYPWHDMCAHEYMVFSKAPDAVTSVSDVWCRPRMAAYMNNAEIDRVCYISFHSNASNAVSRGAMVLKNSSTNEGGPMPYCDPFNSAIIHQVEDDLKYYWKLPSRNYQVYTSAYGELTANNINNEMAGTILEVAFHDNAEDTALLKNPGFRQDTARAVLQGIIDYFSDTHKNAPKIYLPDAPGKMSATIGGTGQVALSWEAPVYGGYGAGQANGYIVYKSPDGLAWDNGIDVGNVLLYNYTGLAANQEHYFRVAAYNEGGISFPGDTVGVRMTPDGNTPKILIVQGYDRYDQSLTPFEYDACNGWSRRIKPWLANSFNYIPVHGKALADAGYYFDSSSNDKVTNGQIRLSDYRVVDWILGRESDIGETFDTTEQSLVAKYLNIGGRLLISGGEVGWDLEFWESATAQDKEFLHATLHVQCTDRDGSNTNIADGLDGSIFAGIQQIVFSKDLNNGFYDIGYPNAFAGLGAYARSAMKYRDTSKIAAVQYADGDKKLVIIGFPLEMVQEATLRKNIMNAVLKFFE